MREFDILVRDPSEAAFAQRGIAITEAELRELYVAQQLSAIDIARKVGCHASAIYQRLHDLKIPVRSYAEAALAHSALEIPETQLRELYLDKQLSTNEVARHYGCDGLTIRRHLQVLGIPIRSRSEALRAHHGIEIAEAELRELYEAQKLPAPIIAELYNCDENNLQTNARARHS